MAAGRPPTDRPTAATRVYADTRDKLGWLIRLGVVPSSAEFLEERAGAEIDRLYARFGKQIDGLKAAAEASEPVASADLGGEGG